MRVFVGYQNINSGAKIATEHLLAACRSIAPTTEFIVYNQHPYRFSGPLAFTRNFLWSVWDFKKKLDATDGTLTALYSPYYLFYFAKMLSRHRRTPFYFHLHGDQAITELAGRNRQVRSLLSPTHWYATFVGNLIVTLQKHVVQQARQVFFVSTEAMRHFCQQYQIVLPPKKAAIVANGVSLQKFFPISQITKMKQKKHLLPNPSVLVFLYVGRLDHKKGVLELIQSLALIKIHQAVSLIIVYPDIPDKYSQQYLNVLKRAAKLTQNQIIFRKNPPNLAEYYQISDLVLLPSYQEMMPLVMLEAFACGVPFMGSGAGNMRKILGKVNAQLILDSLKPKHIARKIRWFLSLTPAQKQTLIKRETTLAKRFSWDEPAKIIIQQLAQLPR